MDEFARGESTRTSGDPAGSAVTFTVLGESNGAGHAVSLAGSARVHGNGAIMAMPSVAAFLRGELPVEVARAG